MVNTFGSISSGLAFVVGSMTCFIGPDHDQEAADLSPMALIIVAAMAPIFSTMTLSAPAVTPSAMVGSSPTSSKAAVVATLVTTGAITPAIAPVHTFISAPTSPTLLTSVLDGSAFGSPPWILLQSTRPPLPRYTPRANPYDDFIEHLDHSNEGLLGIIAYAKAALIQH